MSQFNVYKSSAGSGKTFTLVKSYLSIALKDTTVPPVAYKSILAITFTNKAAGEMKERVVSTLRSISESGIQDNMGELLCLELKITSDEIKLRAANLLNAILHNYSDFSIGTIDRFVHRVIRTFALDLKLPMNFSIETNTELVLARCVDELIGKVGNDPVLTDVLLNFSRSKAEDQKNWRVETELLLFIKKFIAEETDEIFHGIKNHDIPSLMEAAKYMRAYMRDFLEELKQKAAVNDLWIKNQGLESTDFTQGGRGVYSYFTKIADGEYLNNVYGAYVKAAVEEDKWKSGKSNLSDDQISYLKSKILELEEFRKQGLEKHKIYSAILKNIYSLMVIHELQTIFLKIKQEENFVFISEFNSLISEIINTQPVPFVYERIGEKYKHYLLDEFQDTSVIQWNNLLPLVDNSLASGNFNMVVGDGKQSIYRWRGGDVDQFADLPKIQGKKNKVTQEREDSLIRNYREDILKTNFRSKEEIVDFNNQFFDHAREKIIPEKYQKVYKDSKQEPKTNSKGGFVSFDLIDPSENSEISKLEVCALVENYINKNCKEFGYNYSDITILVRTKRNGKLIADFLLSKNIPIVSSETLLLSSNPGVCMLLGLMNLLQTERDQIDEAKIIRYFSGRAEMNYQSFDLLWKEFNRSTGSVWTFMKQKKFIQHNREYFSGLPLYELCCALIREFRPDAADNIFIQFFLDEIIKYSKNNPENLSSFIEWWQQNGKNCSAILPSGANAVN
ncbi:MAG: UvrD-helicase domain-containing protein, partial [Bacteroidota bacterium]